MSYLWAKDGQTITNRLLHTQQHTTHNKNQKTLSKWSPQAAGFQRLQFYRQVWLPYVARSITIIATWQCTFFDDTSFSFIYFTIILSAVAQSTCWLKVFIERYFPCFFCAAASKRRALSPAIRRYLIWRCRPSTHLVLAWFCTGGRGCHCHDVFRKVEVGSVVVSVALLILVNT